MKTYTLAEVQHRLDAERELHAQRQAMNEEPYPDWPESKRAQFYEACQAVMFRLCGLPMYEHLTPEKLLPLINDADNLRMSWGSLVIDQFEKLSGSPVHRVYQIEA